MRHRVETMAMRAKNWVLDLSCHTFFAIHVRNPKTKANKNMMAGKSVSGIPNLPPNEPWAQ